MERVIINTIKHEDQRYNTVGDWEKIGDELIISVSDTKNWRYNMAIALHELVEALLCLDIGTSQEEVDIFDKKFLQANMLGEPGDHPDAPYRMEHGFATSAERMLISAMNVNWADYEKSVDSL